MGSRPKEQNLDPKLREEQTIDPKFAKTLEDSTAAYQAETDGSYEKAAALHTVAANRLAELAKKGGFLSFLSREKRLLKRQVETKISLHQERIKVIALLDSNKDSKILVPAVTSLSVASALGAKDGTPKALSIAADARAVDGNTPLSLVEIQHPENKMLNLGTAAASLHDGAPAETWVVRRPGNTAAALEKNYFFTVKDATETNTLYLVEAPILFSCQLPMARLSRAGEYPHTSALIKLWRPAPMEKTLFGTATRILHKSRPVRIKNDLLPEPVWEDPDMRDSCPWGPRRFTYGARKFVWKPKYPEKGREDGNFETLYEYRNAWPRSDGSGVQDDDAEDGRNGGVGRPLCWCDPVPTVIIDFVWTIHFVGGLDSLFKEHLIASQVAKMAAMAANSLDST